MVWPLHFCDVILMRVTTNHKKVDRRLMREQQRYILLTRTTLIETFKTTFAQAKPVGKVPTLCRITGKPARYRTKGTFGFLFKLSLINLNIILKTNQ